MRLDQRPEIGTTVYLRPNTRTCSPVCYRRLAAEVVSYAQWPYVLVSIREGTQPPRELLIHSENMGLHPQKQTSSGDSATDAKNWRIPKLITRRPGGMPPLVLGPDDEELPLW